MNLQTRSMLRDLAGAVVLAGLAWVVLVLMFSM